MQANSRGGLAEMTVPIVVRSHNDRILIERTLQMIQAQTVPFTLHVFDNDSTDGTLDILPRFCEHIHRVPAGTYVPGKVLNAAMEAVDPKAPFVVFLNSDCTPVDEFWLENLLKGFSDDTVAAVFGRQMPRPDCLALFAKDTEDTFGDGSRQKFWKHCFSMASSAVRRSCWEQMPFRTDIQYSEDIDWTWRARQQGWTIQYVKESRVYHSHNYTYAQFKRRQMGEGKADAQIFTWSRWERTFLRYSLLPYLRQVKSDVVFAIREKSPRAAFQSPVIRFAQLTGRRKGFMQGLLETHPKDGRHDL